MTEIDVRCEPVADGWRCGVRVSDERGASTYDVTVRQPGSFMPSFPPGAGARDIDRLVRETFAFLLEREPQSSILPAFDLSEVGRYFPEYPAVIRARIAR